ncbi:lipase maturation factor family protein [Ruania halotolerans]|uniref:lipase maturation factor family protein n=1 Tax=Ruania halotolerans TaxID=2897773 RepID=UPI001E2EEACE|nr:lipase maturation factor family protein [Ruania halotolerans]UFU08203.1 lipase maturation factor family protein [Ruania halotolerans]
MEWFAAEDYHAARFVLQRGIALMYLVAFVAVLRQFLPLLGSHGLLPVPRYVERVGSRAGPTIFRWRYSDTLVLMIAWAGVLIAAALVAGLPQSGPPWVPFLAFAVLYLLYLSVVNVGQVFYGFGWESLLLEAGFLAAFLGSDDVAPPLLVLLAFRWLLFRVEFGAGMIKMRGDRAWRDLTALDYHHETQPMPGPLSWFFHHLPRPLHRVEVAANHVVQLAVPFLLFLPQPIASIAAVLVIATQLWLVLSGNFAWLNWLTMLLAFSAVGDDQLAAVLPALTPTLAATPTRAGDLWWVVLVMVMAAVVAVLAVPPARNLFSRHQAMNASYNRFHLGGAYGAFGSITRVRHEVVVEGTEQEVPDGGWCEYVFSAKPGPVERLPGQFAPYHLRLDWGMWFLALGSGAQHRWFSVLLRRLLEADRATLRLFARDPFDGRAPRWVRARMFTYRYSTPEERRATGHWWVRSAAREFVEPVGLAQLTPRSE